MTDPRARVLEAFAAAFGGEPTLVARAPGRVNLIGEHTDYNDGFVLPAAISVETCVAIRPNGERLVRVLAADFADATSVFPLDEAIMASAVQPWSNYVRGMVAALLGAGFDLPGVDIAVAGSVPQGSGLSSSASLAVAVGTAFDRLSGLGLAPSRIAQLAQASECDFVGTRCGIMDQLVSARGVTDHALLIDCRSLECTPVALPQDVAILIVHSGVVRGLVEGEYNLRRLQCEAAAAELGVAALRDADLAMLERAGARIDPLAQARARHVITENTRTLAAAEALAANDLVGLGQLMAASHSSMREDFAITVPPVDALVAELQHLIGAEGGARMTGGGFGGAVVALLRRERLGEVTAQLAYRRPDGGDPLTMIEQASAGASAFR